MNSSPKKSIRHMGFNMMSHISSFPTCQSLTFDTHNNGAVEKYRGLSMTSLILSGQYENLPD